MKRVLSLLMSLVVMVCCIGCSSSSVKTSDIESVKEAYCKIWQDFETGSKSFDLDLYYSLMPDGVKDFLVNDCNISKEATIEEWASYEIFSDEAQEEFAALSNLEVSFSDGNIVTGSDFMDYCEYLEKFGIEDIDDIRKCTVNFSHDDGSSSDYMILVESNGNWGVIDERMLYYIKSVTS